MTSAHDELRKALKAWRALPENRDRSQELANAAEALLSEPPPDPDARLRELLQRMRGYTVEANEGDSYRFGAAYIHSRVAADINDLLALPASPAAPKAEAQEPFAEWVLRQLEKLRHVSEGPDRAENHRKGCVGATIDNIIAAIKERFVVKDPKPEPPADDLRRRVERLERMLSKLYYETGFTELEAP